MKQKQTSEKDQHVTSNMFRKPVIYDTWIRRQQATCPDSLLELLFFLYLNMFSTAKQEYVPRIGFA